jgi:Dicarboxylate transport
VRTADLPAQALTVTLAAQRTEAGTWEAQATATAPGLALAGQGTYRYANGELDFKVPGASIDLKTWQTFVDRLLVLPEGPWALAGQISGSAAGRLVGQVLTATATVRLRDGEFRSAKPDMAATGITADLEFTDVVQGITKPGTLQVRALRTGQLAFGDVRAEFALAGGNRANVTKASLEALGGHVAAEPFNLLLGQREVEAVLLVEGIQIAQVMALTKDLPAQAQGRVNGRMPVRLDSTGLRLGTGWLALMPGVAAEVQFKASGLLTGGVSPSNPGFPVLQKIEAGLLKLRVNTLRLDIRPPNAPTGRSAQLHLEGEPLDRDVKAPVILDLNVNGPLEQLLNLGLDSRVSFGSKP